METNLAMLKRLMNTLSQAVSNLESYLENLPPSQNLKEGDIKSTIQSLQAGLTQHTNVLLRQNTTTLELAVSLLQSYFQATKSLSGALSKLEKFDSAGSGQGLYTNVINYRNNLEQELTDILKRLNLTETDANDSLPANNFCTQPLTDTQEFVDYLIDVVKVLNSLNHRKVSLLPGEIKDLISNWDCAIDSSPTPPKTKHPEDAYLIQLDAIAKSIKIHDLLNKSYGDLADIVRSGDPLNPAIL